MPFEVTHDGLVREFELVLPVGWEYWLQEIYDQTTGARDGFPLVIMLHGSGQDPKVLMEQWPLHELLNRDADYQNKFILLVPYGHATMDPANPAAPRCEEKEYRPVRSWNAGITGISTPQVDDVGFIEAAITAIEAYMQERLDALGSSRNIVDANRIFVFGYSNGGMMAYHLANQKADYFAALWVMAGTYGATPYNGYASVVENAPSGTTYGISLMAHHGGGDTTIDPGTLGTATGTNVSPKIKADLINKGGLSTAAADDYAPAMRTLEGAVQAFVTYNDGVLGGVSFTKEIDTTGADLAGNTTSTDQWYYRAGTPNPAIRLYYDPEMDHTNFTGSPDRYVGAGNVWAFFRTHPRV